MNIRSKVVEVAERRVGGDEVDARSGAPGVRRIRLRGDQASIRVVGVGRADGVGAELDDLLQSVSGGGRINRPRPNGVIGRVVLGGVPGLVEIMTCQSRAYVKAV